MFGFLLIAGYSEVIFVKHCQRGKNIFKSLCPSEFSFPRDDMVSSTVSLADGAGTKKFLVVQPKCFTVSLSSLVL